MDLPYNDFRKLTYTTNAEGAYKRGCIAIENGDFEGALLDFSDAINHNNDFRDAYVKKLYCLLSLNRYKTGIPISEKLCQLEPNFGPHYITLAICLENCGELETAEINYTKSITLNPNEFETHFGRGELRLKLRKYEAAFYDFTKCIEISPERLSSYDVRGRIRGELNDYRGAVNDFEHILSIKSDDSFTIFNLAITHINNGQSEKGKQLLSRPKKS